jgi:hypothetical protein
MEEETMMRIQAKPRRVSLGILLGAMGLLALALVATDPPGVEASPPGRLVVLAFGPGGVLTRDGTLWQYRPDTKDWVTIDTAFRDQGQETRILPLPVPVEEIESMESFGFILTRKGECWLYDLEANAWKNVGPPPERP